MADQCQWPDPASIVCDWILRLGKLSVDNRHAKCPSGLGWQAFSYFFTAPE